MDKVNSEDKGYGKSLYENNLTIPLSSRLEMFEVVGNVPNKAYKIKTARGEREHTCHYFYQKKPKPSRNHQIRLVSSRFKPIKGGSSSPGVKLWNSLPAAGED